MLDISVDIDQEVVRSLLLERIDQRIREVDTELVFWTRKELIRLTGLSWNTILEYFFYDQRFKKYKVGSKQ